jgi:NADH:ubiquinone oxidoreductase subunit 3 (subunit A)
LEKHVPNFLAGIWALGFVALTLVVSRLVRPERPKAEPAERTAKPWIRMAARHQILMAAAAMFFLGALLMLPAAATFRQWLEEGRGVAAIGAVGLFLGTLSVALAFAWIKGDLSWSRHKEEHGDSRKRVS